MPLFLAAHSRRYIYILNAHVKLPGGRIKAPKVNIHPINLAPMLTQYLSFSGDIDLESLVKCTIKCIQCNIQALHVDSAQRNFLL